MPNARRSAVATLRTVRLSIVGLGVVGRWLAAAIERRRDWLASEHDVAIVVVSAATRRGGFVHRGEGLDIPTLIALAEQGRPLAEHPGTGAWPTAADGLAATEFDVLAEASNTDPRNPEPSLSHLLLALNKGTQVVTSSKGACAFAAVELLTLARERGLTCRMESTVMSGTPVLNAIRDGLAGARVRAVRGILNGTANYILTRMSDGVAYDLALAEAQRLGFAEPNAADDVEGHDVVAKSRVLAAVAFGQSLGVDDVARRGITDVSLGDVQQAIRDSHRFRLVASVRRTEAGGVEARVEPVALPLSDPLARVDGVMNALTIETDTTTPVTIIGPGAGREQAGQGIFADLVAAVSRPGV